MVRAWLERVETRVPKLQQQQQQEEGGGKGNKSKSLSFVEGDAKNNDNNINPNQRWDLNEEEENIIGRADDCHIQLNSKLNSSSVSRKHAKIVCVGTNKKWRIFDTSVNGIYINDTRVRESPLKDKDEIIIGTAGIGCLVGEKIKQRPEFKFVFRCEGADTTALARLDRSHSDPQLHPSRTRSHSLLSQRRDVWNTFVDDAIAAGKRSMGAIDEDSESAADGGEGEGGREESLLYAMDEVDGALRGSYSCPMKSRDSSVRVFLSSTFTDFSTERNALMEHVFPFLRDVCSERGLELLITDMRWGIRNDATIRHETASICLTELERCQQHSVGPNFVLLLGDKYGYRPLPSAIEEEEFALLRDHISKTSQKSLPLLDQWYEKDDNTVPASFRLRPISDVFPDIFSDDESPEGRAKRREQGQRWWEISRELHFVLSNAAAGKKFANYSIYTQSVTEAEVMHGIFEPRALLLKDETDKGSSSTKRKLVENGDKKGKKKGTSTTAAAAAAVNGDDLAKSSSSAEKWKQLVFWREIEGLDTNSPAAGNFVDMKGEYPKWERDEEARTMLQNLKDRLVQSMPTDSLFSLAVQWKGKGDDDDEDQEMAERQDDDGEEGGAAAVTVKKRKSSEVVKKRNSSGISSSSNGNGGGIKDTTHEEYVKRFCDLFCEKMVWAIIHAANHRKRLPSHLNEEVVWEAVQSVNFGQQRANSFISCTPLLQTVVNALIPGIGPATPSANRTGGGGAAAAGAGASTPTTRTGSNPASVPAISPARPASFASSRVCVVTGGGGSGKTSLLSAAAALFQSHPKVALPRHQHSVISILRWGGSSRLSSSVRGFLRGAALQLAYVLNDKESSETTLKTEDLTEMNDIFQSLVRSVPQNRHLLLVIDALERVVGESSNLFFLPPSLPSNVSLLISVDDKGIVFDNLKILYPEDHFWVRVEPLTDDETQRIFGKWLEKDRRQLQKNQMGEVMKAARQVRSPLFLRLLYHHTADYTSSTQPSVFPPCLYELISKLIVRCEERHGLLASHAFGLLVAARYGLSSGEILDILSCDDEVLTDVFQYWTPPVRRLPPLLWERLRRDVEEFLAERGGEGGGLLVSFFHRQFFEVVCMRYLGALPWGGGEGGSWSGKPEGGGGGGGGGSAANCVGGDSDTQRTHRVASGAGDEKEGKKKRGRNEEGEEENGIDLGEDEKSNDGHGKNKTLNVDGNRRENSMMKIDAEARLQAIQQNGLQRYLAIADYFDGTWADGKPIPEKIKSPTKNNNNTSVEKKDDGKDNTSNTSSMSTASKLLSSSTGRVTLCGSTVQWIDRKIARQDMFLGEMINQRKMDELPFALIRAKEWERLAMFLANIHVFRYFMGSETLKFDLLSFWRCIEEALPSKTMQSCYDDACDEFAAGSDGGTDKEVVFLTTVAQFLTLGTRYSDAQRLLQKAETILQDRPTLLLVNTLSQKGELLRKMGLFEDAAKHFQRVLALCPTVFPGNMERVADAQINLASVYLKFHHYETALPLAQETLKIKEAIYSRNSLQVSHALNSLGLICQKLQKYDEAKSYLDESLTIRERYYGPMHPHVATVVTNLGSVLNALGKRTEAKALYERSVSIRETVFGPDDPRTASGLNDLATCLMKMGELERAKTLLRTCIFIWETKCSRDFPDIAAGCNNLGYVLYKLGDYAGAVDEFQRSLTIRERSSAINKVVLDKTRKSLAQAMEKLNNQKGQK